MLLFQGGETIAEMQKETNTKMKMSKVDVLASFTNLIQIHIFGFNIIDPSPCRPMTSILELLNVFA